MERRETKYGIIYILKRVLQNNITERERKKKLLERSWKEPNLKDKNNIVIVLTSNS